MPSAASQGNLAARRLRVAVLIPAHDEAAQLPATLRSVLAQSRQPDYVLVVADRCSDETVEVAAAHGVTVRETVDNGARKAGALNQGFACLRYFDLVLQLDSDTELREDFIAEGLAEFEADDCLAGVCGRFFAKPGRGLLHRLQRIEYARYDQNRHLKRGRVCVLSGTATMLRVAALPVRPWSETSLVEDYALTLALKRTGWRVKAGTRTFAYTDTMRTVCELWRQRLRWARGTMEELWAEGWKPYTRA